MVWVYLVTTHDTFGNSHAINRDEVWTFKKHRQFDTLEEAEQYVLDKSVQMTEMVRFYAYDTAMTEADKTAFKREFCFTDDKYMTYRRLFIGTQDIPKLKQALRDNGVKVIEHK